MKLKEIRGAGVPDLGEIRLRPGDGLVGWTGGDARHRRAFTDFLRWALGLPRASGVEDREGPRPEAELGLEHGARAVRLRCPGTVVDDAGGGGRCLAAEVGADEGELALAWSGAPGRDPGDLLEAGARLLARLHGLDRIEAALRRVGGRVGPRGDDDTTADLDPEERSRLRADLAEVGRRLGELADVPERLRSLESELRSLRSDAAEVTGDLEAGTAEWLRERQDAETHLQAYRDRARELRDRIRDLERAGAEGPCPFCGRRLEEHYDEVVAELGDEWEKLVQDGRWWRRRWEQLEPKPPHLRELEGRAMRLQAAVEECAEELERCRFDLRERDELRVRRDEIRDALGLPDVPVAVPGDETAEGIGDRAGPGARAALEGARSDLLDDARVRLIRCAGAYVNRITGGRLLGLVPTGDGGLEAVEDGRRLIGPTEEDRAAIGIALHLALAVRAAEEGFPLASILVEEPFDRMEIQARLRAVELLRALRDRIPQILLVAGGEVADAAPERFDGILEVRGERPGRGSTLRRLPGGVGSLALR